MLTRIRGTFKDVHLTVLTLKSCVTAVTFIAARKKIKILILHSRTVSIMRINYNGISLRALLISTDTQKINKYLSLTQLITFMDEN